MPHQPPQRRLVEFAIPERRDQRQPEAMQGSLKIGSLKIGSSKIGSSKVSHWSISLRLSRRRDNKKPRPDGGVLADRCWRSLSRASISSPRKGSFFRRRCDAHIGDHSAMMIGDAQSVNVGITTQRVTLRCRKKKPGSSEPGLRYWPCEADTITFQEGLLSFRATGGGGQMRNANAQRRNTMIRVGALRQPPAPHVSHAESGGWRQ